MGCWQLVFHLILMFLTTSATAAVEAITIAKPGCPDKCGNVSIPYPFGIKDGCFRDDQEGFRLFCNDTYQPPKPSLYNYYFLEISLEGEAMVTTYIASNCYNKSGYSGGYGADMFFDKSDPFTFSNTRNKFTAIGCDTQAYIKGKFGHNFSFTSGCMSFCWEKESVQTGDCTGIGCCQTLIPAGAKGFVINVSSSDNHSHVLDFNPCSYALLSKDDFKFDFSDLTATGRHVDASFDKRVPVVVDWVIGNQTCELARRNSTSYACKSMNSTCYNSSNGPGYHCKCSQGFQGNPYLQGGCKGAIIN